MPKLNADTEVKKAAETGLAVYWKVGAVTVRYSGQYQTYACLTCLKTECIHVSAVRAFRGQASGTTGAG